MALRTKESKAIVEAMYHEFNRIYFGNKLPKNAKIVLKKMPKSEFKFSKDSTIVVNKHFALDSKDKPAEVNEKMKKTSLALRKGMILLSHKTQGKKPIMSKRFKDALAQTDAAVICI
jgi:hypothetical protein